MFVVMPKGVPQSFRPHLDAASVHRIASTDSARLAPRPPAGPPGTAPLAHRRRVEVAAPGAVPVVEGQLELRRATAVDVLVVQ